MKRKNNFSIISLFFLNFIFSQTTTLEIPKYEAGTKAFSDVQESIGESIYEIVDQSAEFPGGINLLRKKFADNFDASPMEGEGEFKTDIRFIVEADGSISQVNAIGSNANFNREAEITIKALRMKFTPAKVNGIPVRSRFRFPVSMNFQ